MQEAIDQAIYAPYLERQRRESAARDRDRRVQIEPAFDYAAVPGFSNEMIERFSTVRPSTIDEASRIAGVTPAALSALHFALVRAAA
jgi:tRNA uridine 5-carboxymethylaminomethyl modification enzyme